MKKHFESNIKRSISKAQHFFERNFREISDESNRILYGFPEIEGRERITEWGATSAALAAINKIGVSSSEIQSKFHKAKEWLISEQHNGGWEASGIYSAEATAGVMVDLCSMNALDTQSISLGVDFLKSCYKDGYYLSTPTSTGKPHIFTTLIVMKCLDKFSQLEHKSEIRQWILSSQASNGRWGQMPNSNVETFVHTAFALNILHFCGASWEEIRNNYKNQIKWIYRNINNLGYTYEEIEIVQPQSDKVGRQYKRLRLRHFALPLIGHLSMGMGNTQMVLHIARKIVLQQFDGGWGPSKDELTMWATHQAIEYLESIGTRTVPSLNNFSYLFSYFSAIPFVVVKSIFSIIGILLIAIFLLEPSYRPNILVGLFVVIAPWMFKVNKT